jgi:hypothetical protein
MVPSLLTVSINEASVGPVLRKTEKVIGARKAKFNPQTTQLPPVSRAVPE